MKITHVEYRELRSFGQFQNQTIGCTVALDDGDTPEEALMGAQTWVRDQLDLTVQAEREENAVANKSYELAQLERQIEAAKSKFEKVKAFLISIGIDPPVHWSNDELPF